MRRFGIAVPSVARSGLVGNLTRGPTASASVLRA
jgi:hypothetical protein